MNKISIVLLSLLVSACSALDSSSDFIDVIETVKDRKNYVEVLAKSYRPDFKSVSGPDIMKSSLALNAIVSKTAETVPQSNILFEVSYFQNYDEYQTISYLGNKYPLNTLQVTKNSCNEHCTTTQYVSFPIDTQVLSQASVNGFTFQMISAGRRLITDFYVPAAYFKAVLDEAERYVATQPVLPTADAKVVMESSLSKPNQMVQYLYSEATSAEQQEFANWAFANRAVVNQPLVSEHKLVTMMVDWYQKADKADKAAILAWLISQE